MRSIPCCCPGWGECPQVFSEIIILKKFNKITLTKAYCHTYVNGKDSNNILFEQPPPFPFFRSGVWSEKCTVYGAGCKASRVNTEVGADGSVECGVQFLEG